MKCHNAEKVNFISKSDIQRSEQRQEYNYHLCQLMSF